ncbi:hypothetical protein [Staphylococcus haemolyticus]|uniref:hypothetical protein n=1 Tax=Staphylococcus haemolyticus TaxID=1283 RepID=UPI0011A0D5E7|nr:hypothetical protein [Staphylococcus haemolyticus]
MGEGKGIDLDREVVVNKIEGWYGKESEGVEYGCMDEEVKNGGLSEIEYLKGEKGVYGKEVNVVRGLN